jgi:pSer/pThr/pTyr-binding forkhead associated (FHA) protein
VTEFDTGTGEHNYYIEDLGSTNRTFVGDKEVVERVKLHHGDRIRLGPDSVLLFEIPGLKDSLME